MNSLPPCWPKGQACPNECAASLYEREIYNRAPMHGPWAGWRMAGRELVSPDGDRITPERLRGLVWRLRAEARRDAARAAREKRIGAPVFIRTD
ncbi:hypothetical protein FQY83_03030 [Luteimonas marina]|uniref:Uncharacterized protein n=1 Tax=Luteimonas marina TaxID=488485 RepID=A0A5C5UCQ2_9GAMM|nr:DUF3653 domain-containing protein [Luteimonas marina]TWT23617.1 hypothetical protein FQY83_03030 [Luteimonas marina]